MSKSESLEWIPVAEWSLAGLNAGAPTKVTAVRIRNKNLCVAKYQKKWHAFDAKCPHSGGPLPGGNLNEAGHVVCPWHRYAFDIRTGNCANAGFYIDTYPVKEEDGQLWVGLKRRKFLGLF